MRSNNIIVEDYLKNLKEDKELDRIFPLLLISMGFRIVTTALESKGQPQYGKDIIAIKKVNEVQKKYFFELKGHADKDIDMTNFSKKDGIRDSLIAQIDTPYNDSSIPGFNEMPKVSVIVHNGIMQSNFKPTFDGFISKNFKKGEFERWDIYTLTEYFSEYLFNEYLFAESQSITLFKRTLALIDTPGYNLKHFKQLVDLQIHNISNIQKGRAFSKFFATQKLLCAVLLHYGGNNLEPVKNGQTYLVLKTWAWILQNNLEKRRVVKERFSEILQIHCEMLDLFFARTINVALMQNGLFSDRGGPYEQVAFPNRCFEYLDYLTYLLNFQIRQAKQAGIDPQIALSKSVVKQIIEKNLSGFRPNVDNYSISVVNIFTFFRLNPEYTDDDQAFLRFFLKELIENTIITYKTRRRFPFVGSYESFVKLFHSRDSSNLPSKSKTPSILLPILFELCAVIEYKEVYDEYYKFFWELSTFQLAHLNFEDYDIEELLFTQSLNEQYFPDTESFNPSGQFQDFKKFISSSIEEPPIYRTEKAGFPYLIQLAHSYFKNEQQPSWWRAKVHSSESSVD